MSRSERKYRRRQRRAARSSRRTARQRNRFRSGLYRDPDRAKICGVCAGFADYFGIEAWQMRLGAILGLVFIPQLTFCGYFVSYFLMDKKPYYRRVTDRFDRAARQWQGSTIDEEEDSYSVNEDRPQDSREYRKPRMSNGLALRTAKSKFTELEDRVRSMETHVTSSKFELQRELKKLSGEN
jgi:phage shock protein C|tara:strand:+ start:8054 stop:8599 length:546 start_codon:yes stop_codon:yes gene_type:complete